MMELAGLTWSPRGLSWSCIGLLLLFAVGSLAADSGGAKEYCQEESFVADCEEGHVILMTMATYGRENLGRCATANYGALGCKADALPIMHAKCSGRQHCDVSMMDRHLRVLEPCAKDLAWHLNASYQCVPVHTRLRHECRSGTPFQIREHESGYLSSLVAATTTVGTATCPWEIVAPAGQTVNITLYNFIYNTQPGQNVPAECVRVAQYRDPNEPTPTSHHQFQSLEVCASGSGRQTISYHSHGNRLEVRFVDPYSRRVNDQAHFLIKFQLSGCADLTHKQLATGATFHRDADHTQTAKVGCELTEETWYLTCDGSKWLGALGNCSQSTPQVWNFEGDESFPFGILVVVAVGVALGIFLGGTLLLVVSVYMKRRHIRQESHVIQSDCRPFHDSTVTAEDYYRKQQELTEMQYTDEMVAPSSQHVVRVPVDEYKIAEYRPPFSQVSYSSTVNVAPKNTPHLYESPKFS